MNIPDGEIERVNTIVGEQRRQMLIEAAADRSVLSGLFASRDQAIRHAQQMWPDPPLLVAPGQVWKRRGPAQRGDIGALVGRDDELLTIESVNRAERMVHVGGGRYLNFDSYLPARYQLVEWHPDFLPGADNPQPPAASEPPPEEQDVAEPGEPEPKFDPRAMFVLVQREAEMKAYIEQRVDGGKAGHGPRWLPMLSPHYRAQAGKCGDCYVVTLDVVSYLSDPDNLANYRAGWPDFSDNFRVSDSMNYFNELCYEETTISVDVAAYLGNWLWHALRGDVVREHGGTVADYDTGFSWSRAHADDVVAAFPLADPTVPMHVDHPLLQCDGQDTLL